MALIHRTPFTLDARRLANLIDGYLRAFKVKSVISLGYDSEARTVTLRDANGAHDGKIVYTLDTCFKVSAVATGNPSSILQHIDGEVQTDLYENADC